MCLILFQSLFIYMQFFFLNLCLSGRKLTFHIQVESICKYTRFSLESICMYTRFSYVTYDRSPRDFAQRMIESADSIVRKLSTHGFLSANISQHDSVKNDEHAFTKSWAMWSIYSILSFNSFTVSFSSLTLIRNLVIGLNKTDLQEHTHRTNRGDCS